MTEAIFNEIGPVLMRWMMGTSAAPVAPSAWRDEIGGEPGEAELRLLALSGQFLGTVVVVEPPGELKALPDLPVLALPTLPDALRPLARRVQHALLRAAKDDALPQFLAARGWTMHPADWMPFAGNSDAPEVYAPWREWVQTVSGGRISNHTDGRLTAESWEDFRPDDRLLALVELRLRDPDAARALLEAKIAGEKPERRYDLLRGLVHTLSEMDAPFLERIAATDRADEVRREAASLLRRLGRGSATGEDSAELAGFFEVRNNDLLRRSRVVAPLANKGWSHDSRFSGLFNRVGFAAFAGALGLAPAELIEAWSWGNEQLDKHLADMASRSATDEDVVALAGALAGHMPCNLWALRALVPRFDAAQRAALARQLLQNGDSFWNAFAVVGAECRIDGAIGMPAGAALLGAPADELRGLGMIASRTAAMQALERLVAAGLPQADPRLDMIRLNAALDDKGEQ
jgi:hypothetical protein